MKKIRKMRRYFILGFLAVLVLYIFGFFVSPVGGTGEKDKAEEQITMNQLTGRELHLQMLEDYFQENDYCFSTEERKDKVYSYLKEYEIVPMECKRYRVYDKESPDTILMTGFGAGCGSCADYGVLFLDIDNANIIHTYVVDDSNYYIDETRNLFIVIGSDINSADAYSALSKLQMYKINDDRDLEELSF